MKIKNTYKILSVLASLAILNLYGCTKYLDIKPYGKTIPKTAEEFSALLHATLEEIDCGENYILGCPTTIMDLECYADNLEANLTDYSQGNFLPLYIGKDLSKKQDDYKWLYSYIRDCNLIIGYIEDKESDLSHKVIGTAYAIRGICYYNLLRDFCDPAAGNLMGPGVPLVTEFNMEAKPTRSTIAQTVHQIESDFNTAIRYNVNDADFKFSPLVMKAYLARLYFWTGDWQKALVQAQEVLESRPLIGGNAYKEMMESQVETKGNVILKSYTIPEIAHKIMFDDAQKQINSRPATFFLMSLFPEKDKDIRFNLSFDKKWKPVKKMSACIRSAEMQLVVAECRYHLGDKDAALGALNELRRHRISPYVDYTMDNLPAISPEQRIRTDALGRALDPLLSAIINERQKELFMEGDRWYELKRNGRPEFWAAMQGRKYTTMRFMYTFPLPIQDIELVPGLKQNPGYDKTE